jgi:nitrite reductase (NADH) large subunit
MNMLARPRLRLVIVGNGMAGIRTLEEILHRAPHDFSTTVFGAEPHGNYNRIMLTPVLAGEKTFAEIVTHDRAWYADRGIELVAGEAVVEIDRTARLVRGDHGTVRPYDVVLLATGSDPIMLPLPGAGLPGVVSFRGIADVETMLAACRPGGNAVVIGGGLLGLEAAHGLSRNGMAVTVLHLMPTLMERQLDPVSAGLLLADLAARGIATLTEVNTRAILGDERVTGVALADGRELPADLVVMAVGIRPCTVLARAAGLAVGRGVQVDDAMRSSDPAIYAVGECVEHRGAVFGLVAPIWDMAKICADNIARAADSAATDSAAADSAAADSAAADSAYVPAVSGTRLKVTGIDMFSAGNFADADGTEAIVMRDDSNGVHKRLVLRDNRLAGVVLYGDAADSGWYFDFLQSGADVAALRDALIFGPSAAGDDRVRVASDGHVPGTDDHTRVGDDGHIRGGSGDHIRVGGDDRIRLGDDDRIPVSGDHIDVGDNDHIPGSSGDHIRVGGDDRIRLGDDDRIRVGGPA